MEKTNRRRILRFGSAPFAFPLLAMLDVGCGAQEDGPTTGADPPADSESTDSESAENETTKSEQTNQQGAMLKIQYLEIVSPDVDSVCQTYQQLYGVQFGQPDAFLGNARTTDLPGGGLLGVRAPLRDDEKPVVRPYFLVEDIDASVAKAADAGAQIAVPPMELPGHGKCAILIQGGSEHGLWQVVSTAE